VRVLQFGTFERGYPRNAQVASALRAAGVEVVERHVPVWEGSQNWQAGPGGAARIALAELRLARRVPADVDAVLVGYPGQPDVPSARRAARGRPVVFDALVSLHETLVEDRRRFRPGSLAARALLALDRTALRGADLVVADTRANAEFLAALAGLPPERVEVCLVGAEDRLFGPGWRPAEPWTCLFVGKLIPLHGVETILGAARLAPEIPFRIVGSGQLEPLLADRPANAEWVPWVAYEKLPGELHRAGCALGVFGRSPKAARVIPNKAYQALACGTPLVTGATPAARELLADGESALLVPPADPDALATAVRRLRDDAALAARIAVGSRAVYEERASEAVLGARWRALLERLCGD
jgi:glycosyltransferase involved in cell wall biosynthesis